MRRSYRRANFTEVAAVRTVCGSQVPCDCLLLGKTVVSYVSGSPLGGTPVCGKRVSEATSDRSVTT